jgi:Tfp pilus assembly protein PilF
MTRQAGGERQGARGGAVRAAGLLCAGLLAAAGCVSEEQIKKADGYYQEGVAVLRNDQQSAYVSFQKALKANPRHRDAHYYVAYIYATQEKFASAEEEVREALRIDPDYPEAYNFLGQMLMAQKRRPEAIQAYRKAVSFPLYATPDVAYYQLGLALELEGDMKEALQAFEDALKVNPPNVQPALIYLELGRAHYKLGEDSKAREALARAVSLDKDKGGITAEARALMERLKL